MSDFSIILEHPDSEEIIKKLMTGSSPKEVSQWLKLKYPNKDQSHLRITIKLLKSFIESDYTNCYAQFSQDLIVSKEGGKLNKKIADSILNNKTYRERLNEIADQELDVRGKLISFINICESRAEQVFDQMQQSPSSFKGDHVFVRYMKELFDMVEKFERLINNAPDQIIQHNITVQTVEQYVVILQEAVREVLQDLDQEAAMKFMDVLYNKIDKLQPPQEVTQEDKIKEVMILEEKLKKDSDS